MRATVAVIEDDPDILDLLHEVLEADGFEVVGFARPDPAAVSSQARAAATIVIDLMLPGMTGIELASRLRESAFRDTPMIAISASRLMLEVAIGSGLFRAAIAKPFDLSTLLHIVESGCSGGMAGMRTSLA